MKTKNLPLIVGIALPIIFILVVSIVIFTPSLFVKPRYDFVYTTEDNYYGYNQGYKNTYAVEDGHVVIQPLPLRTQDAYAYKGETPELYLYEVKTDTSHQISFDRAKELFLDPGPSSPDGYTVLYKYGNNGLFDLFGSNNESNGYFVSKGNGKKKLSGLTGDRYWNQNNFKLIGWVK